MNVIFSNKEFQQYSVRYEKWNVYWNNHDAVITSLLMYSSHIEGIDISNVMIGGQHLNKENMKCDFENLDTSCACDFRERQYNIFECNEDIYNHLYGLKRSGISLGQTPLTCPVVSQWAFCHWQKRPFLKNMW